MDYKCFCDPSERLKCLICHEVAREPKQHEDCGKIFCSECIEKNGNNPCPNCRSTSHRYFLDKRGKEHPTRNYIHVSDFFFFSVVE